MDTTVVGIDVSKDRLDVHVHPDGTALNFSRDASGIEALIGKLAGLVLQSVAVEATGGFETVVVASLAAAGLPVVVVNPAYVRAYAKALGKRAKTDPTPGTESSSFSFSHQTGEPRTLSSISALISESSARSVLSIRAMLLRARGEARSSRCPSATIM